MFLQRVWLDRRWVLFAVSFASRISQTLQTLAPHIHTLASFPAAVAFDLIEAGRCQRGSRLALPCSVVRTFPLSPIIVAHDDQAGSEPNARVPKPRHNSPYPHTGRTILTLPCVMRRIVVAGTGATWLLVAVSGLKKCPARFPLAKLTSQRILATHSSCTRQVSLTHSLTRAPPPTIHRRNGLGRAGQEPSSTASSHLHLRAHPYPTPTRSNAATRRRAGWRTGWRRRLQQWRGRTRRVKPCRVPAANGVHAAECW